MWGRPNPKPLKSENSCSVLAPLKRRSLGETRGRCKRSHAHELLLDRSAVASVRHGAPADHGFVLQQRREGRILAAGSNAGGIPGGPVEMRSEGQDQPIFYQSTATFS